MHFPMCRTSTLQVQQEIENSHGESTVWLELLACGYKIIFIKNLTTPHEREQNIILLFQKKMSLGLGSEI